MNYFVFLVKEYPFILCALTAALWSRDIRSITESIHCSSRIKHYIPSGLALSSRDLEELIYTLPSTLVICIVFHLLYDRRNKCDTWWSVSEVTSGEQLVISQLISQWSARPMMTNDSMISVTMATTIERLHPRAWVAIVPEPLPDWLRAMQVCADSSAFLNLA